MSATIGLKGQDAVFLFTDRAVYDEHYTIVDIQQKVATARNVPLVVATRGSDYWGYNIAKVILEWADDVGVDEAVETFREGASRIWAYNSDLANSVEVVIGCWSPSAGPRLLVWRNRANKLIGTGGTDDGRNAANVLEDAGNSHLGFASNGDPYPELCRQKSDEASTSYASFVGKTLMDHARNTVLPPCSWSSYTEPHHAVGGGVDMAIVNAYGVTVHRIIDWPDKVGERINPLAKAGTAAPILPEPKQPNQQQRLALRALEMKRRNQKQKAGRR